MNTFIDIHVLQSVPPSNLNRDDTGSPKTAVFGGVRRARVSSQAWKRATRMAFDLDPADVGYRTTRVVQMVAEAMANIEPTSADRAVEVATAVLKAMGFDPKPPRASKRAEAEGEGEVDKTPRSEYLVFFSAAQIDKIARYALEAGDQPDKREAKALVRSDHGVDVGLFGRMVADDASLNVDAAVQVAHAISTHAVNNEYDYYTAVDDKNPAEETGAGMIGAIEFNSATLYRYATINVKGLIDNLGSVEAASKAAESFTRGFVTSMPSGKQNTFANRTLPEAVVVMVRHGQPVNLVGAFETPVATVNGGYVLASAQKLAERAAAVAEAYGAGPEATHLVVSAPEARSALESLGTFASIEELVGKVGEHVGQSR